MLVDGITEQCLRIFADIEQGDVVVGPSEIRLDVRQNVRQKLTRLQILDSHFILSASDEVFRDGRPASINADF